MEILHRSQHYGDETPEEIADKVSIDQIPTEYLNHKFTPRESDFCDCGIGTHHAADTGKCIRMTRKKTTLYVDPDLWRAAKVIAAS